MLGGWATALEGYRAMIDGFFRMYGLGGTPGVPPPAAPTRDRDPKTNREDQR